MQPILMHVAIYTSTVVTYPKIQSILSNLIKEVEHT